MADLIDRQAVIDLLKKNTTRDIEEVVVTEKNIKLIMDMPKAYDVEHVLAELKEYATSRICYRYTDCPYILDENISCENCGAMGAIDIVKAGGING